MTDATPKIGRPVEKPCGTTAAHRRHVRNGEEPCDACREAYNAQQRAFYARRRARRRAETG